jgi:UDP-N-acetylglucosamine 2-epimerase (non-hydrolysing)
MAGLLIVLGTRPEAIKLAPVIDAARRRGLPVRVCATGQHSDMLAPILKFFSIVPDYDLQVMAENQSPLQVAARVFERLPAVFADARPDWTVVQGDTTTTYAAAAVSFHERVRLAHVEAGLRTGDRFRPFPEEINRRLTTVLADLHFAPTEQARQNLLREAVPPERIFLTGNTIVDAVTAILQTPAPLPEAVARRAERLVVVTAHRRESFGRPLERICRAVLQLAERHADLAIVFPVHRNPAVRQAVASLLTGHPRILLLDPLPYPEFVHLLSCSCLVLTDSGGIQEEAPTIRVPALVLREVTERPEALDSGWVEMVGSDPAKILERAEDWLTRDPARRLPSLENPFGDGRAAERIADLLRARLAAPPTRS